MVVEAVAGLWFATMIYLGRTASRLAISNSTSWPLMSTEREYYLIPHCTSSILHHTIPQ